MNEHRSLILKVNRLLGAQLVQRDLIGLDDLDAANEVFLEKLRSDELHEASILKILIYETQTLSEDNLIAHQIDELGLGSCRLSSYFLNEDVLKEIRPDICRITWTLPFDYKAGFWFLGTAYFLSSAVVEYWEKQLRAPIIWYLATTADIAQVIDSHTDISMLEEVSGEPVATT